MLVSTASSGSIDAQHERATMPACDRPPPLPLQTTAQTNVSLPDRQVVIIYGCLLSCVFLAGLDAAVMGTAGPVIARDLNCGDYSLIVWVVSAYLLTSAACMPCYGKLSDIFGRQPCFQFAIWTFAFGSLLCAVSTSISMLVLSRAIQGVGCAGIIALSQTVIGDMLAPAQRGRYQGLTSSVTALSSVAGPVVGALFADNSSWRGIFYLNLPFCAVLSVVTHHCLRFAVQYRRVTSWRHIDWLGSLLVVAATTALVVPLVWGGVEYPWSSPFVVSLLVVSVVLFGLFGLVEYRVGDRALLPLHMFSSRNFCLCLTIRFLDGIVLFFLISLLPDFFETVWDCSPLVSGLRVTPLLAAGIVGAITSGQSIARLGGVVETLSCGRHGAADTGRGAVGHDRSQLPVRRAGAVPHAGRAGLWLDGTCHLAGGTIVRSHCRRGSRLCSRHLRQPVGSGDRHGHLLSSPEPLLPVAPHCAVQRSAARAAAGRRHQPAGRRDCCTAHCAASGVSRELRVRSGQDVLLRDWVGRRPVPICSDAARRAAERQP